MGFSLFGFPLRFPGMGGMQMAKRKGFKSVAQRRAVMAKIRKQAKKQKSTIVVKRSDIHSVPKVTYHWQKDKKRKALHPGLRVTKTGSTYFENRRNRSDKSRTKKL